MKLGKKILLMLVLLLLAGLSGGAHPVQSQDSPTQQKMVVFESVGSPT